MTSARRSLETFCAEVSACARLDDVGQLFAAEAAHFGYGFCAAWASVAGSAQQKMQTALFRRSPGDWAPALGAIDLECRSLAVDPTSKLLAPSTWLFLTHWRAMHGDERDQNNALPRQEWRSGLSFPIRAAGSLLGLVSVASTDETTPSDEAIGHLNLLAIVSHQRCRELANLRSIPKAIETPTLTESETSAMARAPATGASHLEAAEDVAGG